MIIIISLGALIAISGILLIARGAIFRGRLSGPRTSSSADHTLEPSTSGIAAFSLGENWLGLVLFAIGSIMLLTGVFVIWPD